MFVIYILLLVQYKVFYIENVPNAINYLLTLAPTHNSSNTSHIKFSFSDNLILLRILSAYIDVIYFFLTKMIGVLGMNFFDIHKMPNKGIPLSVQRKLWLRNFMQAFFVVFFVYMAMYLIRNNFKAAQPLLKEEIGLTTLELGYIGLAFSITYGLGKTILGYFVDGRNTKRIISLDRKSVV